MRWLARGEHEVPPDDAWLAPAEAARLARYRFTKRRTEYRLRRWAGKQAVAAFAGLDVGSPARLAAVEVLNRPTGAPYVQVDGVPLGVDISLTDRAGWAVCLVGERLGGGPGSGVGRGVGSVGVDLEIVEPRSDAFVEDFLTPGEREHVRGFADRRDRDAAANLVWSAKESALKVLRTGLRADTRSVDVRFGGSPRADGWSALEVVAEHWPGGARALPGWWRRDGVFVLTVVYDEAGDPPVVLPATADLALAEPINSWQANPLS